MGLAAYVQPGIPAPQPSPSRSTVTGLSPMLQPAAAGSGRLVVPALRDAGGLLIDALNTSQVLSSIAMQCSLAVCEARDEQLSEESAR